MIMIILLMLDFGGVFAVLTQIFYLAVRCTDHYLPADLYHAEQKGPFHAGVGIRVYERSFFP